MKRENPCHLWTPFCEKFENDDLYNIFHVRISHPKDGRRPLELCFDEPVMQFAVAKFDFVKSRCATSDIGQTCGILLNPWFLEPSERLSFTDTKLKYMQSIIFAKIISLMTNKVFAVIYWILV